MKNTYSVAVAVKAVNTYNQMAAACASYEPDVLTGTRQSAIKAITNALELGFDVGYLFGILAD